jgi:hypothetical protein
MANTSIQILRSYVTDVPPSLADGELAYSFTSNTMFIGDRSGEIVNIGGYHYISTLESATSQPVANTLVLRDQNGSINAVISLVDGGIF